MRTLSIILLLCSLTAAAQHNNFTPVSSGSSPDHLTEKIENAETLFGEFEQTKVMKMMDAESTSYGKIYYKSPDIIKWEYTKPFPYSLLFKNNHLYINDDGHKSEQDMSSNKMFAKLGNLISGSLNGKLLKDDKNFTIEYSKNNNLIEAEIRPKDQNMAEMFEKVIMTFSSKKMLKSVKLVEDTGDYTLISFKNWEINSTIDPAVFQK